VTLRQLETLPLKLRYFQGPRHHIALQLLWRPVGGPVETHCGRQGNYLFFNPDDDSAPTSTYQQLLARGWQVVPPEAFRIPDDEVTNPCNSEPVQDVFCNAGSC